MCSKTIKREAALTFVVYPYDAAKMLKTFGTFY